MIRHIDQRSLGTISDLSSFPDTKHFVCDSSNTNCLSGRTTETLTLLKTYQDILRNQNGPLSKGLVVVHGESGSGKTSLVEVLRHPVSASNGYFCAGKFFQQSRGDDPLVSQEPYSAIMAAFSDLCDLVLQSSNLNIEQRIEIQRDLGPDADLLVRAISNLSPFFVDSHNDLQFGHFDTTNRATVTRFINACKRFVHAMSSKRHPIVLFIHDIQWMDDGSRQLIEALLNDDELQNVLLIFAYRDEEADSMRDVFSCELNVVDIAVDNLDARSVQQLLSSLLGSPPSQFISLIDVVLSRTCGNPFHVIQFIEAIMSEDLLVYDAASSMWIFDIGQIKKEMTVSETVCALLSRRINNVIPAMQEVLKVASLIGYCFTKEILINVATVALTAKHLTSDQPGSTNLEIVDSMLVMAIEQGFIELTKDVYHFSHDKLQDSFQNMVEPSDVSMYHYLIGNQYVFHCQTEDAIFQAAIHLNKAGDYALGKERRDKLARINLEAAKRCQDRSAFDSAARFLRHGLKLLDEESHDKWTKCFNLAFEISECLSKIELILGNLDACKQINMELILRSKSVQ
jgi:predicted ATPase